MKHWHIVFIQLLWFASANVQAQTDVTDYITNPDFENDGITGWKTTGCGPQTNNSFKLKHGTTYVENWTGRGNHLSDGTFYQELTDIPLGVYTVTAVGHHIQEDTPDQHQTGAWFIANASKTAFGVEGEYSVTATCGDGTLKIGVVLKGSTANWVAFDNFRMTYTVVADSLQPYVIQMIKEAEEVDQHLTSDAQTELDAAKAELSAFVDSQQTEGLIEALNRLKEAIRAYRFSLASDDNPFDMTDAILNPDFEDGIKGWTVQDLGPQTNNSFSQKSKTTYVEKWTWGGNSVGSALVSQKLTGLPSGKYRLTCVAFNVQEGSSTRQKGAEVFAGDETTPVNRATKYTVEFISITGDVEIGFRAINATGNWIGVDNFHLYYLGDSFETSMEQMRQTIEKAEEQAKRTMNADTLSLLNNAIEIAKAVDSKEQLPEAAKALENAILSAKGSADAYEALINVINEANALLAEGGEQQREEMTSYVAEAQNVYDNSKASNEELKAAAEKLKRDMFIFQLANGTGDIPEVTTHPEVIYGCKAAVGRLKIKGSNILEQGFCWSTEPEPTVLDNRSTQYYDFNGRVFMMPDLKPATTYYVRAYAMTKNYAVGYGDVVRIITLPEAKVTYTYNWAGDDATNERINNACIIAVENFNIWTAIRGFNASVNYDAGDDGAHGSYGGWITIGAGFAQNPGTVMHEMGHGIGVGQHWRYTSWDSPLHPTMYWTGERANRVFAFFENQPDVFNADGTMAKNHTIADGDRVHVCYGLSGVTAPIDLLRQAAFYQGMYEDGMPAVGDGACPYYSFDCNEETKYYLTNVKAEPGERFLNGMKSGTLLYRKISPADITNDDTYAWNITYEPTTGFYMLKNVGTGKYMTYNNETFRSKDVEKPTANEKMQLMPARKTATVVVNGEPTEVKPYWLVWGNREEEPPTMTVYENNSKVNSVKLNFYDTALNQHWMLLTEEQVNQLATGITLITDNGDEASGEIEGYYDLSGRRVNQPVENGFTIVRYKNGHSGKIFRK